MSFRFNTKKANSIILYLLHSLGGAVDILRLIFMLYLADLRHLAKYGSLITGDTYIAMKFGPAPFHILAMLEDIKERKTRADEPARSRMQIDNRQVKALGPHDPLQLAPSEVECLFEIIQKYKGLPTESLSALTTSKAWQEANNVELQFENLVAESGATAEMREYIEMSYKDELESFNLS